MENPCIYVYRVATMITQKVQLYTVVGGVITNSVR